MLNKVSGTKEFVLSGIVKFPVGLLISVSDFALISCNECSKYKAQKAAVETQQQQKSSRTHCCLVV